MQYLEIALPIPVHKNFYYSSEQIVEIGSRVKVKFGSVYKIAYVISVLELCPKVHYKILPVIEVIDRHSFIGIELMRLAEDMSRYDVETERMLEHILASLDDERILLILLADEMFDGTEPGIRVDIQKAAIKLLHKRGILSIVATHDLDLADFAEFAAEWMSCTMPYEPGCDRAE